VDHDAKSSHQSLTHLFLSFLSPVFNPRSISSTPNDGSSRLAKKASPSPHLVIVSLPRCKVLNFTCRSLKPCPRPPPQCHPKKSQPHRLNKTKQNKTGLILDNVHFPPKASRTKSFLVSALSCALPRTQRKGGRRREEEGKSKRHPVMRVSGRAADEKS
jgi:hypothetical protein